MEGAGWSDSDQGAYSDSDDEYAEEIAPRREHDGPRYKVRTCLSLSSLEAFRSSRILSTEKCCKNQTYCRDCTNFLVKLILCTTERDGSLL
jgi:hypothetical protein